MATKKVGPPVPPRPSAVSVAHTLAKSRSASPTVQGGKPPARTVIYKSPSLENTNQNRSPEIAKKPAPSDSKPNVSVRVVTPPVPKPRHKSPARAPPTPLQATTTQIDIEQSQAIAFTNKFLSEVAAKNNAKPLLPNRPDPEGKEKDLKSVDPSMNNKLFSEMLISELTALHALDKGEVVKPAKVDVKIENNDTPLKIKRGSISSNDVSPNGTKSRIRTSDWIEVGDNGKEVLMTSCHISLEDSGMEDEEKLDDASSGVGDSWDSVKDTEER